MVSPFFFRNILSFKQLKRCYLHLHYIRINKQTLFRGKNLQFLDSRFVKFKGSKVYKLTHHNWHFHTTLVYQIDVHARLLFWEKIPPARPYFGLHVYWFWGKVPPTRLFHPVRLLILVWSKFHGCQTFLLVEIHCYLSALKSWHNYF